MYGSQRDVFHHWASREPFKFHHIRMVHFELFGTITFQIACVLHLGC